MRFVIEKTSLYHLEVHYKINQYELQASRVWRATHGRAFVCVWDASLPVGPAKYSMWCAFCGGAFEREVHVSTYYVVLVAQSLALLLIPAALLL